MIVLEVLAAVLVLGLLAISTLMAITGLIGLTGDGVERCIFCHHWVLEPPHHDSCPHCHHRVARRIPSGVGAGRTHRPA